MVCAKLQPAVSGLEQEFPGKVKARNVDCTTKEGQDAAAALGFKSHGLVIRGADGKALWQQADHTVRIEEVRKALHDLLEPKGGR